MDSHFILSLLNSDCLINPLECFFGIEGQVALDRNPGPGYNSYSFPWNLLSAYPHRVPHIT